MVEVDKARASSTSQQRGASRITRDGSNDARALSTSLVMRDAPLCCDVAGWEGALVTSTSRLALPVDSVELPSGEVLRFDVNQPLIQSLQQKTAAAIQDSSEPLFE